VEVCPLGSYDVLYALANQLFTRFTGTHSNVDYEEATALLERILDPNQPGECPESIRVRASSLATQLAFTRSTVFENPEYSEVTISRLRTELSSPSIDERRRLRITESLAIQSRLRFTQYSLAESLEEANSYTSQVVGLSSSPSLAKSGKLFSGSEAVRETYSVTAIQQIIQNHEELLSITPPGTEHHKSASASLQIGMNQSSTVPMRYRISKSPSSITDYHSMRLIPVTRGDLLPLLPCATSSSSCSIKPGRSATSTSQSPSAMTFSS
jgi:hypothetical protein